MHVDRGEEQNPTLIEQVKMKVGETAKSFMIDMWLARHTQEKVLPILQKVLEVAKDEYADAVANGDGIYGAGYCFGAKYVVMLAGEHKDSVLWGQEQKDEEEGMLVTGPLVKAGAIAHATLVTREDLIAVKAPLSMACVGKSYLSPWVSLWPIDVYSESDPVFPEEILEEGRKHLEENKIEHEIKTYTGVPHGRVLTAFSALMTQSLMPALGFAVVGEYGDLKIKEAQSQAFDQMIGWLKAH